MAKPVPPPRRSLGGRLRQEQLELLLESEFTIENFVNQSLQEAKESQESEDDDDDSEDEDHEQTKLSFRFFMIIFFLENISPDNFFVNVPFKFETFVLTFQKFVN